MPSTTLEYRLRVRNQANSANLLILSSREGDPNCLLSLEPNADGQRIDWVAGTSEVGVVTWKAIDRDDGETVGDDFRTITALLSDVDARNQMLSNVCIGEYSRDGGAWTAFHTGYLNAISLPNALEFEFTVGDTDRREQQAELFRTPTPTFPRVSCIIGGPVVATTPAANGGPPVRAWGPVIDYGPARFKRIASAAIFPNNDVIALQFVSGYLPPDYSAIRTSMAIRAVFGGFELPLPAVAINQMARPYFEWDGANLFSTAAQLLRAWGYFPGLVARLTPVVGGAIVEKTPVAKPALAKFLSGEPDTPAGEWDALVSGAEGVMFVRWEFLTQPAIDTQFDVLVYPSAISAQNPLHLQGHPIDLHQLANTQEGIPDDDASAAATKTALGTLFYLLRIKGPMPYKDFVAMLKGSAGYGTRYGADGEQEFFPTRTTAPASVATITPDDVPEEE